MPHADIEEVKKELKSLRKEIRYHNNLYYNLDDPKISDYEYDKLMQRLKSLETAYPELITENSPTQMVGGVAKRTAGVLIKHDVPMLSLQDVFTKEEVITFVEDTLKAFPDTEFVVEEKIDGLSLALRYRKGILERAITRGDGIIEGEDVTLNAKVIKDIPETLKTDIEYLEVRGEVYMSRKAFQKVNERQEFLGLKPFANPRNCAAGTLRQLDSKIVKARNLSIFVFNLQAIRGKDIATHMEAYDFMEKAGLTILKHLHVCKNREEVLKVIEEIGTSRGKLPYDIDGAVVKVNSFSERQTMGATAKVPRWAIAYKYPPEEKETVIKDIELSVGRTGRITPTAIFDEIELCGTKVARATLHNQDFINTLDVRLGDTVRVFKSGEIIPKIRSVVKEKRPPATKPFIIQNICPVCGAKAIRESDFADIFCQNPNCPAQIENHLIYFAGRDAMDIKGLGEKAIKKLIDKGFVKNISDLYKLKSQRQELIEARIFGREKNTDNVLEAIEESKKNSPIKLLTGLGITGIGKTTAKALLDHFTSFENLMSATVAEIQEVQDVGTTYSESIYEYFQREEAQKLLKELFSLGLNFSDVKNEQIKSNILEGKIFVITGTLQNFSRKEMSTWIEERGGKISSSVSKNTDFLIAGEAFGTKYKKAQEVGVKILSEEEVLKLVETTSSKNKNDF